MKTLFADLAGDLDGEPDHGTPLVLLHGLTFDRTMWRPALAELAELDPGRQVLTLDLPGHGAAPAWPSYDLESVARALYRGGREAGLHPPRPGRPPSPPRGARASAAARHATVAYVGVAGHDAGPGCMRWLNQMLPQASVTVWPGSGHFPHLAQPRRFAGVLADTAGWPETSR